MMPIPRGHAEQVTGNQPVTVIVIPNTPFMWQGSRFPLTRLKIGDGVMLGCRVLDGMNVVVECGGRRNVGRHGRDVTEIPPVILDGHGVIRPGDQEFGIGLQRLTCFFAAVTADSPGINYAESLVLLGFSGSDGT